MASDTMSAFKNKVGTSEDLLTFTSQRPAAFKEYLDGMRILKTLGLPVAKIDEDATEFRDSRRFLKCLVVYYGITWSFSGTMFFIFAWAGMSFADSFSLSSKYGMTTWDMNSIYITMVVSGCAPTAYYCGFKGFGKAMTEFSALYAKLSPLIDGDETTCYHRARKKLLIVHLIILVIMALYALLGFLLFRDEFPIYFRCIYSFIMATNMYLALLPPVSAASLEVILYITEILTSCLKSYDSSLMIDSALVPNRKLLFKRVVSDGFTLCSLMGLAGDMLGALTAALYVIHLVYISCGVFFATGLTSLMNPKGGEVTPVPIVLGFASLTIVISSITLVNSIIKSGQTLTDACAAVKERHQELLIVESSRVSPMERAQAEVLIDRFGRAAPIRPLDVFDVNYATAASVSGLILTYVIVLLQFKMSDS